MSRWAVSAALIVLVSGCVRTDPVYVDVPAPTHPAGFTAPECPRDGAGLGAVVAGELLEVDEGAIPPGFGAVSVLRCVSEGSRPGGTVRVEERSSSVTDQLLIALGLPDQVLERQGNPPVACPAIAYLPTLVMLVDDRGRAVVVRQPLGMCGDPRQEVEEAARALKVDTVTAYSFAEIRP